MRANATKYYNAWMIGILNIVLTCHPNMVIRSDHDVRATSLTFQDFIEIILALRDTNTATVPCLWTASQNRWILFGINELINCTIGLCLERAWNMGSCLVVDSVFRKYVSLWMLDESMQVPEISFPSLEVCHTFLLMRLEVISPLVVLYIILDHRSPSGSVHWWTSNLFEPFCPLITDPARPTGECRMIFIAFIHCQRLMDPENDCTLFFLCFLNFQ